MKSHIHLIGNAHLDPAWLWRLDEGFEAFLATCRSALERMDETPSFIFTCSSAACYEFVEQTDPALFERIREAVHEGRWEIVGGWWVEPDCNVPSGESFVRQALYGQHYFRSRFGKICTMGYCIDSFGHNANLPQLLRRAGMDCYVFMRPEQQEFELPSPLFRWHAPSGDEVLAYRIPLHYSNFRHSVAEKVEMLKKYPGYNEHLPWMLFYGVGNHGGGPTREQIEEILRLKLPMSRVEDFFEDAKKIAEKLPVYQGELQHHAIGCYSNHAHLKAANRRAEHSLMRAEKFGVLSETLTGQSINWPEFDRAWKNVLLNQFHDTLGGVSVEEACDDALAGYHEAILIASRAERLALQRIRNDVDTSDAIESLMVFNPHLSPYSGPVEFELWNPEGSQKGVEIAGITLIDNDGNAASAQQVESKAKIGPDRVRFVANCDVPPFGWTRYKILRSMKTIPASKLSFGEKYLRNEHIEFLSDRGESTARRLYYHPLEVFDDESDTWAHDKTAYDRKAGEFQITKVELIEEGPIRAGLRIVSEYGASKCEQDIFLYDGSKEIVIETLLDWREPHAVCKMPVAHGLSAPRFYSDIPYAAIERPADGREYPVTSWAFAGDGKQGIGIIIEGKSSFSCDEKNISFVAARSPLYAHHEPPHSPDAKESKRYLDHGIQRFMTKVILGYASFRDARMAEKSLFFHEAPVASVESGHEGNLGSEFSGGAITGDGVLVTTLKPSITGQGMTLRLNEVSGAGAKARVVLNAFNSSFETSLSPYGIRTYRISEESAREISFLEDDL